MDFNLVEAINGKETLPTKKHFVHGGFIENIEGNQFEMHLNPRLHDNKIWLSTKYEDFNKEQKTGNSPTEIKPDFLMLMLTFHSKRTLCFQSKRNS